MSGYTCRDTYFNYGSYLRSRGYDKEICNLVTSIENGSIQIGSVVPNGTEDGALINGTLIVNKTATSDSDPSTKQGQIFIYGGDSGNPLGDAVIPSELGSQLYHGAHVIGPIYQSANISNVKPTSASTQGYKRSNVFNSDEHIFRAPLDISDTIVRIQGDLIVDGSFVKVADEEAASLTLSAGSTHSREMLDIFHGARQAPGLDIMDVWLDSSQNIAIANGSAPPPAYESLLAFAIDGDLSGTFIGDNGSTGVHGRTRILRGATITSVPNTAGLDISYSVLPTVINPLALDLYGGVRMQNGPTDPSGSVSDPHFSMIGADAIFSIGPSLLQTNAYITADGSGVFQDMSAATAEIGNMNITTLSVNTLDVNNIDASGITIIGDISGSGDVTFNGLSTPVIQTGNPLYINASGKVYENTSSRRYKTNIESINNDTAFNLSSLNPVTFNYTGSDVLSYGLIAEEVVDTSFSSVVTKDVNGDPKGVDYTQLIAPLIALVKQQNEKIQTIEERIAALEPSE